MIKDEIILDIKEVVSRLALGDIVVKLEHPADLSFGDYSTNVAMIAFGKSNNESIGNSYKNPLELAQKIVEELREKKLEYLDKIEVAGNGFINLWLSKDHLIKEMVRLLNAGIKFETEYPSQEKKIMVEFAHPNTHKEMHIGHLRTLITGEALSRILAETGAKIFRANYQGDIGPHVAKAIYGVRKILIERGETLEEVEKKSNYQKAHLLQEGYIRGNSDYETEKQEIDDLNRQLYVKDARIMPDYTRTRKWSLDYYDDFYKRFGTRFDQLFFESEVYEEGKEIVLANVGRVFEESEGAIVFPGEKYGLHKRVFITSDGNPTYEGKDMALAYRQFEAFPFDRNIHVVANEQSGYFAVMIKALEILDPKFIGREHHLPMGMVNLVGVKMSSRTGQIITVDGLLDKVKSLVLPLIKTEDLSSEQINEISEKVTVGAIKFSVLRANPKMNAVFDIDKSVSLDGDSGPYLMYVYARIKSVQRKARDLDVIPASEAQAGTESAVISEQSYLNGSQINFGMTAFNQEEMTLFRSLYKFPEIVAEAAMNLAPNIICNYLFDLASLYNTFYDKHSILGNAKEKLPQETILFRIALSDAVGKIINKGLNLLGIETVEKM